MSCLSVLFGVREDKIHEDFIQLSDLVEVEKNFINRTELYGKSKEEVEFKM